MRGGSILDRPQSYSEDYHFRGSRQHRQIRARADYRSNVSGQACIELRTEHLKRRFEAYRSHQKSLLIGSDVAHDFPLQEGATELREITDGDLISAEKKGSTEVFH
jgi:hypothetical protein